MDSILGASISDHKVALLLDWENLAYKRRIRIDDLIIDAKEFGRLVIARAYADFRQRLPHDAESLYRAGIEPVYVLANQFGKNSTDMRIAADCIELCQLHSDIDTYVLGTGDGDFIHLLNVLRRCGKTVVAATPPNSSGRLSGGADATITVSVSGASYYVPDSVSQEVADKRGTVYEKIKDIVEEQGEAVILSALQNALAASFPNFTQKSYGFTKFKDMVLDCKANGYVKIESRDLVDWVLPVDMDNSDFRQEGNREQQPSDEFVSNLVILCHGLEHGEEGFDTYPRAEMERAIKAQAWNNGISNSVRKRWLDTLIHSEDECLFIKEAGEEYFSDYHNEMRRPLVLKLDRDSERVKAILGE